jgi:hypothetical protein
MSDRVKLAREIAARSEPRFIEIEPERRPKPTPFGSTLILVGAPIWVLIQITLEIGQQ